MPALSNPTPTNPMNRGSRLIALACALLLALLATGCGEATPEEKLADATDELSAATQAKTAAQAALSQLDQRLEDAQAARDKAALAFEETRQRWEDAKDAVGEFATDEVLHRQVNRALLEEPELEGATITAGVEDRVVTLVGGAPDAKSIALASELADAVPGVGEVVSDVVIEDAATAPTDTPTPTTLPELPGLPELQEEPAETMTPEAHL